MKESKGPSIFLRSLILLQWPPPIKFQLRNQICCTPHSNIITQTPEIRISCKICKQFTENASVDNSVDDLFCLTSISENYFPLQRFNQRAFTNLPQKTPYLLPQLVWSESFFLAVLTSCKHLGFSLFKGVGNCGGSELDRNPVVWFH